jgi:hypothetical protein
MCRNGRPSSKVESASATLAQVKYGYNPGGKAGQPPNDPDLSWVHAHMHRMESDFRNAGGWCARRQGH